jgi:hypothetical protein
MKPDKEPDAPMDRLRNNIKFNAIDSRLVKADIVSFKADAKETEFIKVMMDKFGLTLSEVCRFSLDFTKAAYHGGLLEEFVRDFAAFKEQRGKVQ